MVKFVGLRAKTYSYLIDHDSEDKKAKDRNKCIVKRKFKFENYKNCLEASQLKNKINHLEKNKIINIDSFFCCKRKHKEFGRKNNSILKPQQISKSARHNVFTEEINKIDLSSNDDERMQSIDSIETYAYGTSKDIVSEKEKMKYNNIMKRYKK